MSNVNTNAARVPVAAGSNTRTAVRNVLFTRYYIYWLALGTSESQAEWDEHERAMQRMEDAYGYDYLGDIINLCED